MRTKRWVQLLCFSLLFLLSAQPLCAAATGLTNAEVQEFKEVTYAFAEAAGNVSPEIVLAAMPGAIATTEAVGAISKGDAQLLRKVFSNEDADPGIRGIFYNGLRLKIAYVPSLRRASQIMQDATAKRRILLNGYSDAGPAALSSESTEIMIPQ